jgi:AraC-like DNA-binding protein
LLEFIDHNFNKRIMVKDAASMVRMSRSYFFRFFKQVTGQSFVAYLNRTRIAKAQELLASRDITIAEVSQEVGFCHQGYFGMVFHRLAHLTPLQYKRLAARQLKSGVNSNSAPRRKGDGKVSVALLGKPSHFEAPFQKSAALRRGFTPRLFPENSLTLDPGGWPG